MRTALRIAPLVLFALWLTACANLERNAYRTIGTIATNVDAAMKAWGDYVRAGKSTPTQEQTVRSYYGKYQNAMALAEQTVKTFKATPTKDETPVRQALSTVSAVAADLIDFVATVTSKH